MKLPRVVLASASVIILGTLVSNPAIAQDCRPSGDVGEAEAQALGYIERIGWFDDPDSQREFPDQAINAVIALNPDAPCEAREAERAGLMLAGRTVLVKDNIETREWPTTAGSYALEGNMTHRDAPLIARLREAGGVVLGKTNLSEWANFRSETSSSGWSAIGGQTRNPYATDRTPCGSSSGSGAAVAADFAWAAIGTETNGSITCPASVNGLVGLKPTVGMVSRTHVVPISASQDTAGPMAHSVADAALLLNAIAGSDPADPATREADARRTDFTMGLADSSLAGVRIGVVSEAAGGNLKLEAVYQQALADLEAAGAVLVPFAVEADPQMFADSYTVLKYEFRNGVADYLASSPADLPARDLIGLIAFNQAHAELEMRFFSQEVFMEAEATNDPVAYEAARANAQRLAGADGIDRWLAEHEVAFVVAPTEGAAWPIDLVLGDHFAPGIGVGSFPAVAGYPHLTVPMGAIEGLPVGLSFIGARWADHALLKAGAAYERARSAELPEPTFMPWKVR